ncbi:hypothetical protein D3C71_1538720 [compost metagenome]
MSAGTGRAVHLQRTLGIAAALDAVTGHAQRVGDDQAIVVGCHCSALQRDRVRPDLAQAQPAALQQAQQGSVRIHLPGHRRGGHAFGQRGRIGDLHPGLPHVGAQRIGQRLGGNVEPQRRRSGCRAGLGECRQAGRGRQASSKQSDAET